MEKKLFNVEFNLTARIAFKSDDSLILLGDNKFRASKKEDQQIITRSRRKHESHLSQLSSNLSEKCKILDDNQNNTMSDKSSTEKNINSRRKQKHTNDWLVKGINVNALDASIGVPKIPIYLKTESLLEKLVNKNLSLNESAFEKDVLENIDTEKENTLDIVISDDDEGVVGDLMPTENCVNFDIMESPESDDSSNDVVLVEAPLTIPLHMPDMITQTDDSNVAHLSSPTPVDTEEHTTVHHPEYEMTINNNNEDDLRIGTVVWARLGTFPLWPAFICTDAEPTDSKICVKFLADNGRLSRLTPDRVLKYHGLEHFLRYSQQMLRKIPRPVHRKMFDIKKKKWYLAVAEADILLYIDITNREKLHDECLYQFFSAKANDSSSIYDKTYDPVAITCPPRPSSTPCTVDTAYSSMKQSPLAMTNLFDDADVDEINVALIEHDALDNTKDSSAPPETFEHIQHNQFENHYEQIKHKSVNIFQNIIDPIVYSDTFRNALLRIWNMRTMEHSKPSVYRKRSALPIDSPSAPRTKRQKVLLRKVSQTPSVKPQQPEKTTPSQTIAMRQEKQLDQEQKEREREQEWRSCITSFAIKNYGNNPLFRGLFKGPVCAKCHKTENTVRCSGPCAMDYHGECIGISPLTSKGLMPKMHVTGDGVHVEKVTVKPTNTNDDRSLKEVLCPDCRSNQIVLPKCFACNQNCNESSDTVCCAEKVCKKYYHRHCLKYWPQVQFNFTTGALTCPYHVCQTCESDDVQYRINEPDRFLIKCIQCPASYHRKTACIPAGSELLSDTHMICPRHRVYNKKPVNTNWCFFCSGGGKLVCCETCPATYHDKCLADLKLDPGERYICEICESGRLPLYSEIVWVKYGSYRWWPAIIVPPWKIPTSILGSQKLNYFCVLFFGKAKNYGWACKANVYRYEEGDSEFEKSNHGNGKDLGYTKAIQEAKEYYRLIKEMPALYKDPKKIQLKPAAYTRIKTNRAVPPVRFDEDEENDGECKCTKDDINPCSQWSNCLNQLTSVECGSSCGAGDKCENQRFQKRIYPKLEVRRVGSKGWGLFAGEHISTGTFIIEYVGEVINFEEFQRRFQLLVKQKSEMFYLLSLDGSWFIDAGPKGNDARFINHSCEPNCDPQKWTVKGLTRIGFFANKSIPVGTEITFDYDWCGIPGGLLDGDHALTPCCCGTENCSGFIGKPKNRQMDARTIKKNHRPSKHSKT